MTSDWSVCRLSIPIYIFCMCFPVLRLLIAGLSSVGGVFFGMCFCGLLLGVIGARITVCSGCAGCGTGGGGQRTQPLSEELLLTPDLAG